MEEAVRFRLKADDCRRRVQGMPFGEHEASRRGGGGYLWKNIEAAKSAHGAAFQEGIQKLFGSKPEIQYLEAPIVIDNAA